MAVLLFCIVVVSCTALLCYFGWWLGTRRKVDPKVKAEVEAEFLRARILQAIYNTDVQPMLKITLLEQLNISPETMRKCLDELYKRELIIECEDTVGFTTFGVQYYEVFHKVKMEDGK